MSVPSPFWAKRGPLSEAVANRGDSAISDENVQKSGSMKIDEQNYRARSGRTVFWFPVKQEEKEGVAPFIILRSIKRTIHTRDLQPQMEGAPATTCDRPTELRRTSNKIVSKRPRGKKHEGHLVLRNQALSKAFMFTSASGPKPREILIAIVFFSPCVVL